MRVLVVGATGFVGRHVMDALAAADAEPIGFDVALPPQENGATAYAYVQGDMVNLDQLLAVVHDRQIDRVVLLGYIMAPLMRPEFRDLLMAVRTNLVGVTNVFEACRLGIVDRVIFASSVGVYGRADEYGERLVTEDDPLTSTSLYGRMKIVNESLADRYRSAHNAQIVTVRPSAILGVGNTMWPARLLSPVAVGEVGRAPFSRHSHNNILSVEDLAWLYSAMALAPQVNDHLYLATGHNFAVEELLDIVARYIPDAKVEFDEGTRVPPYPMRFSNERATAEFGWQLTSLEESVLGHMNEARAAAGLGELQRL